MKTISKTLLFMIALCMVSLFASLIMDKPLQAATSNVPVFVSNTSVPVNVTNTPLPVSGTVGVSGSVGITGTPAVTVANGASSPVPVQAAAPSVVTHMGQLPGSHITLSYLGGCACFKRTFSDGTYAADAFTVPSGQVFVMTDVEWGETAAGSMKTGETAALILEIGNTVILDSQTTFNADLLAGKSEQIVGGRLLSAVPSPVTNSATIDNLLVSGYLIACLPIAGTPGNTCQ
jgi:hypothetical protein